MDFSFSVQNQITDQNPEFRLLPEIAHLPPHIFFAVTVNKGIPFGVPGYFSIEQSVALWQLQKVCGHIIYP